MFGPAILVVILIATLVFLRGFGEPEITTGAGRTSDLLFARDPSSAIVILDSGSGRVLGRLPDGVLAKNGQRVYGVSTTCQEEGSCTSTVRVTDTATMASNPVGRLDGRLALLGVDEARGRLYLTDSEGTRLLFFDSSLGQTVQTIDQPESFVAAFAPRGAVLSADGSTLFTLGGSSDGEAAAVVTDLLTGRVQRPIPLPGSPDEFAGQLQASGRLYAYRLSEGAVFEIDPVIAQVLGSVQLDAGGGSPPSGSETGLLVATSQGSLIYAIVSSGGIASLRTDQFQLVNRLAPDRRFRSISVSSDGSLLYTIEIDGGYSVFQASSGQQMLHRSNVNASALLQANAGE